MIEQCREVFLFKNCLIRVKLRKQPDICCPAFRLSRFPAKSVSGASLCGKPDVRLSKRPDAWRNTYARNILYFKTEVCSCFIFYYNQQNLGTSSGLGSELFKIKFPNTRFMYKNNGVKFPHKLDLIFKINFVYLFQEIVAIKH